MALTDIAEAHAFLDETARATQARFAAEKTLLGFDEYLDVVTHAPALQLRDAPTYLRDVFLHYGTEELKRPYGTLKRFKLFDCPFDGGKDRLIGQERAQEAVFKLLQSFVRQGRVSQLILLSGPNGSAKTSFIHCIIRALEAYSHTPDGALYTFNWVFPSAKLERGAIGFGGARGLSSLGTYAHLAEGDVDARLRTETRDHPLLLLPKEARVKLLRALLGETAVLPSALADGELSPKAKQIFDALLKAYKGDLKEVLKHVQVERFYVSHRYRQAAVTVDPQMRVDAGVRQITADRSLGSLPPSLHNVTLYEPVGDLVDANRGLLEFNDLLKRPIEAFKYLLATCENGAVRLDALNLYLDTVFIGSCNARHLAAFKELPDFASFKGRIELVDMPYLLDYRLEADIYGLRATASAERPVAPHSAELIALFGVMTRLERPNPIHYPESLKAVIGQLSPLDKALLLADGRIPAGLDREVANTLRACIPDLYREREAEELYEGIMGASARELQGALLDAGLLPGHRSLSPMAVVAALSRLCDQSSVYEFLRLPEDGGYHSPFSALDALKDWYLDVLAEELHRAMGLIDEQATGGLFERYLEQVTYFVRKEKRKNPTTGRYEDPDEPFMQMVEQRMGAVGRSPADFRNDLMHHVATWRMEHPQDKLDLAELFRDRISRINESFYEEKKQHAAGLQRDLLALLVDGPDRLEPEARAQAEETLRRLEHDFGYNRPCAVEVLAFFQKNRPA